MEVSSSSLTTFFTQADVKFGTALAAVDKWQPLLSTTMPSATTQNAYAWMDRIPIMRQWLGDRVINQVSTQQIIVPNLPFELTDALLKEDVMNDQFGIFNMNLQFMAMQAGKWPDQQIANFLINSAAATSSTPALGYDGKTMFATDHPVLGSGVSGPVPGSLAAQSNLYVNTALTYENFRIVRANMLNLKGKDNQPLYNMPDTLVVGPTLEAVARNILEADLVAGVNSVNTAPQSNIQKGLAKVKVIQELSVLPNCWWLMCTTAPVKPIIWQLRQAPQFTYLVNPNDLNVFMSRQFIYGVEAWGAVTSSLWWLAAAATSAATYNG